MKNTLQTSPLAHGMTAKFYLTESLLRRQMLLQRTEVRTHPCFCLLLSGPATLPGNEAFVTICLIFVYSSMDVQRNKQMFTGQFTSYLCIKQNSILVYRKNSQEAAKPRVRSRACALLHAGAGCHPKFGINVAV